MSIVKDRPDRLICKHCPKELNPNGRRQNEYAYNGTTTTHATHLRRAHGNVVDVREDYGMGVTKEAGGGKSSPSLTQVHHTKPGIIHPIQINL